MALSQRKLNSVRANAQKSTGPKTPAGKAAVSLNAVTHGLSAQTVVLHNEPAAEYEAELNHYLAHFQPLGKPECDLVRQLAAAHWRLARYAAVESALLENQMAKDEQWIDEHFTEVDEIHRLAFAFDSLAGANSALALLNRYQARLHREYQKILNALTEMQTARSSKEVKLQNKPNPRIEHSAPKLLTISPPDESAAPSNQQPNQPETRPERETRNQQRETS